MEEWKEFRLGDIISIAGGFAYKGDLIGKGQNYLLGMGCVSFNENFLDKGARQYDGDCPERYYATPGDIVLATRQQSDNMPILGMPAIIPSKYEGCKIIVGANLYRVELKDTSFDNRFIYWLLKTPSYINYIRSCQSGTTVRMITKSNIEDFIFCAPKKEVRDRISNLIWTLDDKIEVNKRINENLEQQAQALFKSWFVDFEPFKDGEFVESELGMIPKGWRVVTLNDACKKITDGSHYSPKDNANGTIPMLSVKDMKHNGFDYSSCKMIDFEEVKRMKANDGVPLKDDILVAKDGSYLKEIFICPEEIQQAILSSIAIFRSNNEVIYPDILLQLLRSPNVRKDVGDNYVSGSALPRIVLKDFKKYKFIVAPIEVQNRLYETLKSINRSINCNEQESRRLATLRDTLLPKLMSGELKVNEVDV